MKRVLIISYYWPPSGGAGVQRWLKFVKYLQKFNWDPVVFVPSNPEMPYTDESLMADIPKGITVIKTPIVEPYQWYRKFTGKKKSEKFQHGFLKEDHNQSEGLKEQIAVWIRGNLFIPDARRLWVRPSVKFLSSYLKDHPVDVIVTTGPPHSVHLIGKTLKKRLQLPWLADFRDPWTGIYYFDKLKLTSITKKIHQKMEDNVLSQADHIVVVGDTMKKDFMQRTKTPITTITNGFDHEDFNNKHPQVKSEKFRILYTGMFLPDQNPPELWEVLADLVKENTDLANVLEILFVGKADAGIINNIKVNGLEPYLRQSDYVPHADLALVQQSAAVLLLCINRIPNASYILTGKVFEYLSTGRPILAICPESSDIAAIIKSTETGIVVPFMEKKQLKNAVIKLFQSYKSGHDFSKPGKIEKYSRLALTERMATLLNQLSSK